MMKTNLRKIFWIIISVFVIYSCVQEEGVGGNSHIKGCLIERVYNEDFSLLLEEKPAKKVDIFLLYGNKREVGNDIETSYTGDFIFEYLWPGEYKVFYYSYDSTNTEKEVVVPVRLNRNETIDLGNLYTYSTLKWNKGTASISGKVMVKNYKNSSVYPKMEVKDITPAQDKEVFLIYGNSKGVDERIRTSYDGRFEFKNLIKGTYLIYVLSEDISGGTAGIPIKATVTITDDGQVVVLETFTVEKL